jgi:hypothetical protein
VRNLTLHGLLEQLTADTAMLLHRAATDGEEIQFEVVETDPRSGGQRSLYCYRPLTDKFISARLVQITELPTYAPVAQMLEGVGGLDLYLRARGERQLPQEPGQLVTAVLLDFLSSVFHERTDFTLDSVVFERAYEELERGLYDGRRVTEVIAPLLGVDIDPATRELALGDGLALIRAHALANAPDELAEAEQPPLLLVLRVAHDRLQHPSESFARARFRRVLTALRLFERGTYSLGTIGYSRVDDGPWSPVPLGSSGTSRELTLVARSSEDELRGFCSLMARRLPRASGGRAPANAGAGEVAWALARFEMGCERAHPVEGLSDHLLALRALLEPEGPTSGRLAQRLSVICAAPEDRAALAERTARAIALERSVITGLLAGSSGSESLISEIAENLRAILRDILCGHLEPDICGVADELLADAVQETAIAA